MSGRTGGRGTETRTVGREVGAFFVVVAAVVSLDGEDTSFRKGGLYFSSRGGAGRSASCYANRNFRFASCRSSGLT